VTIRSSNIFWAGVLTLLAAWPARTEPATETRFFDERARRLYDRGRYAEALVEFLNADAVTSSPRSVYNIAVCADLAGQREVALAYFDAYLSGPDADPERRREAESRMKRLAAVLALVRVESDPPGAIVLVDREALGEHGRTPRTLPLDPGSHEVELRLDGYQPAKASVKVGTGKLAELELKLVPKRGVLAIAADPPGARIELFRAGERVDARVDASSRVELPIGRYRVRVRAPGHAPVEADALVAEGDTSRIRLTAAPLPAAVGRLLVGTAGVTARILVDGRAKAVTPARIDGLLAGRHTVELRAPGRHIWRGLVTIRDGKTTFVEVTLARRSAQ